MIFHFEKLPFPFHSNFLTCPTKQAAAFINENYFLKFLISPWYCWANSCFSRIHCKHLSMILCKRFNQVFTVSPCQREILRRLIVSHYWLWERTYKRVNISFTDCSVGSSFCFSCFWLTRGKLFGKVVVLYFCIDQRYFSK